MTKKITSPIVFVILCLTLMGCPNRKSFLNFETPKGERGVFKLSDKSSDFELSVEGVNYGSLVTPYYAIDIGVRIKLGKLKTKIVTDSIKAYVYGHQLLMTSKSIDSLDYHDHETIELSWMFKALRADLNLPIDKSGMYQKFHVEIMMQGVFPDLPEDLIPNKIVVISKILENSEAY